MTRILFSDDHEYIKIDGDIGTVGVTDFAQKALGDVVYVELPKLGINVEKNGQAGVVESVKSASEIYSPVSGEIVEINTALNDNPSLVNTSPLEQAWFYKIRIRDEAELSSLKDEAAYTAFTQGL